MTTDTDKLPSLAYDERMAIATLRNFIQRKPQHTKALLKALFPPAAGKEMAVNMLQAGKAQLDGILVATQGMMALAKHFSGKEADSE